MLQFIVTIQVNALLCRRPSHVRQWCRQQTLFSLLIVSLKIGGLRLFFLFYCKLFTCKIWPASCHFSESRKHLASILLLCKQECLQSCFLFYTFQENSRKQTPVAVPKSKFSKRILVVVCLMRKVGTAILYLGQPESLLACSANSLFN